MKKTIYVMIALVAISAIVISMGPVSSETDSFQKQLSDFYSTVDSEKGKIKSVENYISFKEQEFGKKFNAEQRKAVESYALKSVQAEYASPEAMVAGYRNMMNTLNPEEGMDSCDPQIQSPGWFNNLCDFAGFDGNPDGSLAGCTYICLDWFDMEDCVLSIPCPSQEQ